MIHVTIEIPRAVNVAITVPRSIGVAVEFKGIIGMTWAGIDEGDSTTVYTDGITDE